MSFDPLLTVLGLAALASPTVPATFAATAYRGGVAIQAAVLPSNPTTGTLAVDSADTNKLKWWDGAAWQTAGGGGGTPAGSDKEIQYNNAGAFGASSEFYWNGNGGLTILKAPTAIAIGQQTYMNLGATAAAGGYNNVLSSMSYSPSTTNNVLLTGVESSVIIGGASVVAWPGVAYALNLTASSTKAAGSVAQLTGINVIQNNGSAGVTVTLAHVFKASQSFSATATTTGYGIYIDTSGAGAVTTYYGLRLQLSASNVTTHYGIYQEGATVLNYFAGNIGAAIAPNVGSALMLPVSTTARSCLRLGAGGVAPTTNLTAGDVWLTATGPFIRIGALSTPLVTTTGTVAAGEMAMYSASGTISNVTSLVAASSFNAAATAGGVGVAFTAGTFNVNATASAFSITAATTAALATTNYQIGHSVTFVIDSVTLGASNIVYGSSVNITGTPDNGASGSIVGHNVSALKNYSGGALHPSLTITGIIARAQGGSNAAAGTAEAAITGLYAQAVRSDGAGGVADTTTTAMYGIRSVSNISAAVATATIRVTDIYGIHVVQPVVATAQAIITNFYGLYIANRTAAASGGSVTYTNNYGIYQADPLSKNSFFGDIYVETAGRGLFIKEGANAKMGVATLVGGTVTVNTTAVTATSRILVTRQNRAGTVTGAVDVTARTAATSFTLTSENAADTSDVAWLIVEPA